MDSTEPEALMELLAGPMDSTLEVFRVWGLGFRVWGGFQDVCRAFWGQGLAKKILWFCCWEA